jgi:hypothetical protein
VTADDLEELVKSLGLGDKDAKDLVGGLDFSIPAPAGTKNSSVPERPPSRLSPKSQSAPGSSGVHHESVLEEATTSGEEGVDEPGELESDTDASDVGELPSVPRLRPGIQTRKRTDEPPMTSPLIPSGSSQSFRSESTVEGLMPQPPKSPHSPDAPK